MFQVNHKRSFAMPLRAAAGLGTLVMLGSPASQAGSNPFDPTGTAAQVGPGSVTTPAYPGANGDVYGTFSQTVGSNTLTYSDGSVFSLNIAPFDVDYPLGTPLLQTADIDNNPTGPLEIDFSQGVGAFGVKVQDYAYDLESFTLTTYNGTTSLGTYTFGPFDNNSGQANQNPGKSVFVGASATGGDVITKVVISSKSVDAPTGLETAFSNDFFVGPVTFAAPVPEASTLVSSGIGVVFFAGLLWRSNRRKKTAAA